MKRPLVTAGVLGMLAFVAPAVAQVQPPQERINRALDRARQVGIPVELLESKIAEGKAKGVSLERIAAVIERRQAVLERAGALLRTREGVQPADVSVTADAFEAGISDVVLTTVMDTAPRERRVVAIAALTRLVELGHAPQAALDRVREALKRGPEVLNGLASQTGGRRGGPPDSTPAAGRGGGVSGPPAGVPGPGEPPASGRPGGPPSGRGGRGQP